MARDVYFDPFGSFAGGYERGAQLEQQQQTQLRAARDSDYKFNTLNPLELQGLQRENYYGQRKLPYDVAALPIAYSNAVVDNQNKQLGFGQSAAQYGSFGPLLETIRSTMPPGITYNYDPQTRTAQFLDPQGRPYGGPLNETTLLAGDEKLRKEQAERQQEDWTRRAWGANFGLQGRQLQSEEQLRAAQAQSYIDSQINDAYKNVTTAQAAAAAAGNGPGFAPGGPNFLSVFGSPTTGSVAPGQIPNSPSPYPAMQFGLNNLPSYMGGPAPGPGPQAPPPQASNIPSYLINPQQAPAQAPAPQAQAPAQAPPVAYTPTAPAPAGVASFVAPPAAAAPPTAGPIPQPEDLTAWRANPQLMLNWMRATNPQAPVMTMQEMQAMSDTNDPRLEQYITTYYPQLNTLRKPVAPPQQVTIR